MRALEQRLENSVIVDIWTLGGCPLFFCVARSSDEAFGLVDSSELKRIRERQIKINEVLPSMTDRLNEYETC